MGKNVKLSRLSDDAISIFAEHIKNRRTGKVSQPPTSLIIDTKYSTPVDLDIEVDLEKIFADRFEFGTYIASLLGNDIPDELQNDVGFWTWLSLAYFNQFCPKSGPNRQEHYVLSTGNWKQPGSTVELSYRHCAKTPVELVTRFGTKARFFLQGRDTCKMGDIVEQLCSKDRIMKSQALLNTLFSLYADSKTGHPKKGCASYASKPKKLKSGEWSKVGFGGIRRLVDDTLPQIKLTFNIDIMAPQEVLDVAGPEFEAFA